jgi:hypothetical protein
MNPDGGDKRSAKSLRHLAELLGKPPATTTGKVIWAWPQISAALQRGWRTFEVWSALREDGIEIQYDQFRVYLSRVRRRLARLSAQRAQAPTQDTPEPHSEAEVPSTSAPQPPAAPPSPPTPADPYSGVREQRQRKRQSGFEYDPFSSDKDLLE